MGYQMKPCDFCGEPTKKTDGRYYAKWWLCLDCVTNAIRQMMERR